MFENVIKFFEIIGVDIGYPVGIIILLFIKCLVPKKVICRIEETKKEDGSTRFDVYKIL